MSETTPIVLVPGLGGSGRTFLPVVPRLWRFGPVTIANHVSDDTLAAVARRILKSAPPRFALAGHSMGGYVAFEMIRQAPERILRLALLNTQARADTPEAAARRQAQIDAIRAGGYGAGADALFAMLVHPSRRNDAALRETMTEMSNDVGAEAYVRALTAVMGRVDSRPTLATIACPTLVLTGDADNVVPLPLSQEMADGIKGAKLVVVPECGHMSTNERPDEVAEALSNWMEQT